MDFSIFGVQSTTLAITAALTGVLLVVGALVIAWLIGPRSYTEKKGEPFECGIPTRGDSMAQYHVGYYLFAILFLMFDVETVFLFPWAFRSGLCLEERSVEMEVKIKSMKHEDFKDNEYIDNLVEQLRAGGTNIIVGKLDQLMNWGVSNSLWPLCFGTSCCAIEFMCLGAARYDMARYGFEVARNSPRQADYIMCQGTINYRMAPALKRLYEQMAEPKYVIACGSCTVSGGPFKNSYCVVKGVDEIIPVDVYLPGCPPRPEAFFYALMQLQRKIKVQKYFGGVNRKEKLEGLKYVKEETK